jgi:anti-sigma factor RsiW
MMAASTTKPLDGEPGLLVHAYLDGELNAASDLIVGRTIETDPSLADAKNNIGALQKVLRKEFPPQPIPSYLKSRIDAAVGNKKAARRPTWMLVAASVVAAVALSSGSTWLALRAPAAGSILAEELIDSHMRALSAPQPIDVASSDGHSVKPWFNGKIPQSPKVVELATEGFPLVGARIDVFGKTPVPTLVYRRRQHLVSLTAVSSSNSATNLHSVRPVNGFNMVSWNDGETAYWAISDLNATELNTFARLFQRAS